MSRKEYDIYIARIAVYGRDGWRCQYPGGKATNDLQMAHIIPRTLVNYTVVKRIWNKLFDETLTTKKTEDILNNEKNLTSSCSRHNQLFINQKEDHIIEYLQEYRRMENEAG